MAGHGTLSALVAVSRPGTRFRERLKKLACSLTYILALAWSASPAGAEPVPDHATGIWSTGECGGDGLAVLVNSTAGVVVQSAGSNTQVALAAAEWVAGFLVLTTERGDELILPPLDDLRRCGRLPGLLPVLFAEAIAVFKLLDDIRASCEGKDSSMVRCVTVAFDMTDVTDDGKFSRAELSRAIRAAGFFIGYRTVAGERTDPFVPLDDLVVAHLVASALGPLVADNLIGSYDFDGDGFVSPAELLQDRGPDEGYERVVAGLASQMAPEALAALLKSVSGMGGFLNMLP